MRHLLWLPLLGLIGCVLPKAEEIESGAGGTVGASGGAGGTGGVSGGAGGTGGAGGCSCDCGTPGTQGLGGDGCPLLDSTVGTCGAACVPPASFAADALYASDVEDWSGATPVGWESASVVHRSFDEPYAGCSALQVCRSDGYFDVYSKPFLTSQGDCLEVSAAVRVPSGAVISEVELAVQIQSDEFDSLIFPAVPQWTHKVQPMVSPGGLTKLRFSGGGVIGDGMPTTFEIDAVQVRVVDPSSCM